MITNNSTGTALSADYADAVKADSRSFLAELYINGTAIDCAIQRLEVTKGSCGSSTEYSVGNLISSTMTAEVKELTASVKGEEVEARIGLDVNGTFEWVTLGFFTISDVKKTMYATTRTGHGKLVAKSGADFSVPTVQSLSQIAYRIGIGLGCTVTLDPNIDGTLVVTQPMNGLSNYQALQILASVVGGYAIDTYDGNVKICLFNATPTHAVNAGMMTALPTVGEQDFAITGVRCIVSEASEDEEGEIPAVGYEQGVVNLEMNNKYMTRALFDDMADDLIGYTYRPATLNLSLGDPRIEGNDVLAVTDADESVYTVPCHIITHTYSGGFHSTIESVRATNSEDDIGTLSPMQTMLSEISSGVVSAKSDASKARNIAGTTAQYFWFEGTDSTETGAHITEVPQDDWKDPTSQGYHSGGNLFARSTGIAVRQGLTELATFGADKAQVGQDGQSHLEMDYHSLTLVDRGTNPYVWFSDLRNEQNIYDCSLIVKREYGTSYQQRVSLPFTPTSTGSITVTVDGISYNRYSSNIYHLALDYSDHQYINAIEFGEAPASGSTITYTYRHGETTETYTATGDGTTKQFTIPYTADYATPLRVYVGDTEYFGMSVSTYQITFVGEYFDDGAEMLIEYPTRDDKAKAFTIGTRTGDTGAHSYALGYNVESSGVASTATGRDTKASGWYSQAEGYTTKATGDESHAEGARATASGSRSHAEGFQTTASGSNSHAEGYNTTASEGNAHAEGQNTVASNYASHAEGYNTTASGIYSHAQNCRTTASHSYQTAMGYYNKDKSITAFEIGNGTSSTPRNIFEVTWNGNVDIASGAEYRIDGASLLKGGHETFPSIATGTYADVTVTFGTAFNSAPHVVACLSTTGTAGNIGNVTVAVHSITTTGFTIRVFNNRGGSLSPAVEWIAIAL